MKCSRLILFLILCSCIISLFSSTVFSIAMSPARYEINFKPNLKDRFSYNVINTLSKPKDLELYLRGGLAKYATLSKTEIKRAGPGEKIPFTVLLELPEELDVYGRHRILVGAVEALPKGGGIGARAAIQTPIYINIPYPGKYIEVDLKVPDVETGQTVWFSLALASKGKEFIHKARAEVVVYDDKDYVLAKVYTNEVSIAPQETKQVIAEWLPAAPIPGEYRVVANISYDELSKSVERKFHIGDLIVEIVNVTKVFYKDIINEFNVYVISKWNNVLSNVHAEVNIYSGDKKIDKILSPSIGLPGWSGHVLTSYWNTKNLTLGTYKAEIIVPYASNVAKKEFDIELIGGEPPKKEEKPLVIIEERPERVYAFSWTTILIAIIVLLIIINIIWLFYKSKNNV